MENIVLINDKFLLEDIDLTFKDKVEFKFNDKNLIRKLVDDEYDTITIQKFENNIWENVEIEYEGLVIQVKRYNYMSKDIYLLFLTKNSNPIIFLKCNLENNIETEWIKNNLNEYFYLENEDIENFILENIKLQNELMKKNSFVSYETKDSLTINLEE